MDLPDTDSSLCYILSCLWKLERLERELHVFGTGEKYAKIGDLIVPKVLVWLPKIINDLGVPETSFPTSSDIGLICQLTCSGMISSHPPRCVHLVFQMWHFNPSYASSSPLGVDHLGWNLRKGICPISKRGPTLCVTNVGIHYFAA